MESNRSWDVDWQGLEVIVQKTITMPGRWRHPRGFEEQLEVHFPLDTLQQLRRFGADIVISNELGFRTLLAVLYTRLRPSARVIAWTEVTELSEHGRGLARNLLRKVLRNNIHAFLALGTGGAQYIKSLGVDEERIFKLAYTTDVQQFAQNTLTRQRRQARRLLYVGQLIRRKGLDYFIPALSRWADAHPDIQVEFVLAGDGPLRASLESAPRARNIQMIFLGSVSYENLPQVYADADIFVFPTLVDTWGVVVNEAMAAGLPVLGSIYAQAVTEMVEQDHTGWTFRPDYPDEIYRAIEQGMTTPDDKLEWMRREARHSALRLTPQRVTDLIDNAIRACTEGIQSEAAHA
jgi:glycosyltransferase involved in cell wall biosynthesis